MAEVQLTPGVFRDFRATVQFHLGKIQQDVKKNTVVQFDGTMMKIDGATHSYPELRSAIREGWLALVGSSVSDYVPQSANVQVRAAQAGKGQKQASTTVQRDETYVGQARKPQATTTDGITVQNKTFNPTLVKDTEGDGRTVGPALKRPVPTGGLMDQGGQSVARIKTATKTSFTVDENMSLNANAEGPDIEDVVEHTKPVTKPAPVVDDGLREGQSSDTGKVVANLKTSTRRKVTVTDANAVAQEVNKLDNATRVALTPKSGPPAAITANTNDQVIKALDNPGQLVAEQKRAQRLAALGLTPKPAQVLPPAVNVTPPRGAIDAPEPIKPVKAKPPQSIEEVVMDGDDLELAPGFRWNKNLHWKTRVKMALTYRDQPDKLALIRGYEVPSVVKQIDAELAK